MKPDRQIIYVTDCSEFALSGHRLCEHTKPLPLLPYVSSTTGRVSRYSGCPDHKGQLIYKMSVCVGDGCNKITKSSAPQGKVPFRCKQCKNKLKAEKNAIAYQKRKNQPQKIQQSKPQKLSRKRKRILFESVERKFAALRQRLSAA